MQTEFLIIGQGISGTMLSWNLKQRGHSCMVIDNADKNTASRVAAGLINPVTGRRIVQTWMIGELMPFAIKSYTEIGEELGEKIIDQKNVVDFFPSPQMLIAFRERIKENDHYLLFPPGSQEKYGDYFNYDFGYGLIHPCYVVDLPSLLSGWRKKLYAAKELLEEEFDQQLLIIENDGVRYKEIRAKKIIFCDGIQSIKNRFFKNLPFAFNKGEALLIEGPDIPRDHVFKKSMSLIPYMDNLFWIGSSYEWDFIDPSPSVEFLDKTIAYLNQWLKMPFTLVEQFSAIRPATIERRPFVGLHPYQPQVGIFNGMGTKGCSLAPYFANEMANLLSNNLPLSAEVNVDRFSRLLKLH